MPGFAPPPIPSSTAGMPSPATQGAEMLGQLPQAMQQYQLQQMLMKLKMQQAAQEQAQMLTPQLRADPSNPQLMQQLLHIYKQGGMSTGGLIKPAQAPQPINGSVQTPMQGTPGSPPPQRDAHGIGAAPQTGLPAQAPSTANIPIQGMTPGSPEEVNLAALAPPKQFMSQADPTLLEAMSHLPTEQRMALARSRFIDWNSPDNQAMLSLPRVPTTQELSAWRTKDLQNELNKVSQGGETPGGWSKWIDANAHMITANSDGDPNAIETMKNDSASIFALSARTSADLERLKGLAETYKWKGPLAAAQINLDVQKAASQTTLQELERTHAKYYNGMLAQQDQRTSALVMNAQAHMAGAMAAIQNAQTNAGKLSFDQVKQLQTELDNSNKNIKGMLQIESLGGTTVPDDYGTQLDRMTSVRDQLQGALNMNKGPAKAHAGLHGLGVSTAGGPTNLGPKAGTYKDGRDVFHVGNRWLFADGSPVPGQ